MIVCMDWARQATTLVSLARAVPLLSPVVVLVVGLGRSGRAGARRRACPLSSLERRGSAPTVAARGGRVALRAWSTCRRGELTGGASTAVRRRRGGRRGSGRIVSWITAEGRRGLVVSGLIRRGGGSSGRRGIAGIPAPYIPTVHRGRSCLRGGRVGYRSRHRSWSRRNSRCRFSS